jgi:hypothetical protein
MFQFIRNYLLKRQQALAPSRNRYGGWKSVQIVQLLFDEQPGVVRLEREALEKRLKEEGKKIETISYYDGRKPKTEVPLGSYFRNETWPFGKPRKVIFGRLEQKPDVLIYWGLGSYSPNDFLAEACAASLKIGVNRNLKGLDVCIAGEGIMPETVIQEIIKYSKLINT